MTHFPGCRRAQGGTDVDEYRELCEATRWERIVGDSGIEERQIRELADVYVGSERTIIAWCLGVTQHEHGVDTIRELVNVLLLRGNIGRPGAGPSPVRGHSNVQGNRTCGINNRADHAWLDRMEQACGISAPRQDGYGTVAAIRAMADPSMPGSDRRRPAGVRTTGRER